MSLLGVRLNLLLGPTVPLPASRSLLDALESVEVKNSDEGRSGFQLTFRAGRVGFSGLVDDPLLLSPQLRVFNRVILTAVFGVRPAVLIDGIILDQQFQPGDDPGTGTLTVTGEDVSVAMDMDEVSVEHPAQPDPVIVAKLIATYARFGLIPTIIPPKVIDPPIPIERTPVQQTTDLKYIEELGKRHGHVFYVQPGLVPGTNLAYWGPPKRIGLPQPALTANMGSATNVRSVSMQQKALAPSFSEGTVQDHRSNVQLPVKTFASLRLPPLALLPNWLVNFPKNRTGAYRCTTPSVASAFGQAQAMTDRSNDQVVIVTGELDAGRYGGLLRARGIVGLRGVGFSYDGIYYVQEVTHKIKKGDYSQSFTLTREGLGTTVPVVRP